MGILNPFKELQELKKLRDQQIKETGIKPVRMPWQKACPKCDSTNLKQVKPSLWRKAEAAGIFNLGGKPKTLNVCRDCGFDWEDR